MMNVRKIRLIFAVLVVLQLTACATVFNSGSQRIYVETSPSASVKAVVRDKKALSYQVQLPTVINARPSSFSDLYVALDSDCYLPSLTKARKYIASPYWLNVFNIHGLYIDYFTGGMWRYKERLLIPLIPSASSENSKMDCNPADKWNDSGRSEPDKPSLPGLPDFSLEREIYRNTLSIDWVMTRSPNPRTSDATRTGFGFSYLRHLSRQYMINIRFRGSSDSRYLDCASVVCQSYMTDQTATLVSFRRYLTPSSNFFGGLGAGRVQVNQVQDFYFVEDAPLVSSWSDEFTTLFAEIGWLTNFDILTFNVRAVVDFSDMGLSYPALRDKAYLGRDLTNLNDINRAKDYQAAARLTGVEASLGISF